MIERATSAERINEILNHPEVRPYVVTHDDTVLDVSAALANQRNHFLLGEHGAVLCFWVMEGIFEFHIAVLPEGRGEWTVDFAYRVEEYMFVRTDAVELLTRIPVRHHASRALATEMGYTLRWSRPECVWKGRPQPYDVMSKTLQTWLSERDIADVLAAMVDAGNLQKAIGWERRWAVLSREKARLS